jgi:SAM-dependent MidA family methyltransferase
MHQALYGESGFYLRERPDRHFRTSVNASPAMASAVLRLLRRVDAALGLPPTIDLVDMGSGTGLLASRVLAAAPPDLAVRLRVTAVDLSPRPDGLDERIVWAPAAPDLIEGLIFANEWLDNVPVDVAELTQDGPRLVLVEPSTGEERLGPAPDSADLAWLDRWWPLRALGDRAEIGLPRDAAWAALVTRLVRGTAVAADYAHPVDNRPASGTLTGYRDGHLVPAIPDGSCDITAHVALDACAAAAEAALAAPADGLRDGAGEPAGRRAAVTALRTQREALRELGVRGERPPLSLAHTDPRGYVTALSRASEEAELIDPSGLGGFGWLEQRVSG